MGNFNKEKVKKIAGICGNVLVWILLVFSLLVTILVFSAQGNEDGVPSIFGKSLVTIESGSMEPTYKGGDLVFMTKLSDQDKFNLKSGDIITYRAPIDINNDGVTGDINTHRVVSVDVNGQSVKTQGDNKETNPVADSYTVRFTDIIGICTEDGKLAGVGSVIKFLRSSLGFFLCIVLPLILFFLYELYNFISLLVTEKAKKAAAGAAPAVDEEEIKRRAIEEYLAQQKAAESSEEASEPQNEENTENN